MSDLNLSQLRHDLRTTINHIIGHSEMLQEEAQDRGWEDHISEFRNIGALGREILELVNEHLDSADSPAARTRLTQLRRQVRRPVRQIMDRVAALQKVLEEQNQHAVIHDLSKIRAAAAGLLDLTAQFLSTARTGSTPPGGKSRPAPSSGAGRPASGNGKSSGGRGHLLVVDDDETTRDMLCRRLERQGHRVAGVASGRQALELVRGDHFDLILLDLMMPDIDGYQVLERLKSRDSLRHIPVIMLSALEEVDSTVRCIELGAEDYLTKPFNPVLLKARIEACLEKKLLRDQEVHYLQQIETINADLEKRVEARVKELKESNRRLVREVSERRRLEGQLENKIAEMAVVDEIARIITSTLDIDQAYQQFALEMQKLLRFDRISISVIDHDAGTYCPKYLFGHGKANNRVGDVVPLRGSQTEYVMRTRQPLVRQDVAADPRFNIDRGLLDAGLRSAIMVPLFSKDRVIGSIGLRGRRVGLYGQREQIILERLAKQIAPALENARLYQETAREKERATSTLAQLRALLEGVDAGILLLGNDDRTVLWVNRRFAEFLGIENAQTLVGSDNARRTIKEVSRRCLANPEQVFDKTDRIYADRRYVGTDELELVHPGQRSIQRFTTPIYDEQEEYVGRLWLYYDVTDKRKLEEQLLHAQKMESIGRLAGGIAHDFNNLLTPIMGYATLGSMSLMPEHPTQGHLDEVKKAAKRASSLTQQLLAFSRGQVIEPRVIDLNRLVLDTDELLRRLIGEDIELVSVTAPALDVVKVDPGQMEQVLLNLVINARDAMPQGGRLTISTANVFLDADHVRGHPGAAAGSHVALSVSDTGVGMSEAVIAHLFEPFFTTKEQGKGTGLGLATCYGIVKQSGGSIDVESEVGKGSTFRVYLPTTRETSRPAPPAAEDEPLPGGTETVLLAEDEPAVRGMIATILQNQGYRVLQAANGDEALTVAGGNPEGGIDLLLTDVVMPRMGGVELASRFSAQYPSTKIIFTSGYSDQPIATGNKGDPGIAFIQKPFMPSTLASKVREVLDRG